MKNMSTTAKVIWGIVIAVVVYLIYKMLNKPKPTSNTGTSTGSGVTITNPNAGNVVNTQSFNPANKPVETIDNCINKCSVGDIQCVIKCIGGQVPADNMTTINNIQKIINKNASLTSQLQTNIQRARTQGDVLKAYQTYYSANLSTVNSLNDQNLNTFASYANKKMLEVNSQLKNDLTASNLNGKRVNSNSVVLSLSDKNRIINDISFGKKWDDYKACLKSKNSTGGAIVGGLTGAAHGSQGTSPIKTTGEAVIGAAVGAAVTCLFSLL